MPNLLSFTILFPLIGALAAVGALTVVASERVDPNVRVLEFGIGFPPRAKVLRSKGETLYTLNWLPIGGFVKLEGEDVEVTVLFLDIRAFTAYAERSSAREVVALGDPAGGVPLESQSAGDGFSQQGIAERCEHEPSVVARPHRPTDDATCREVEKRRTDGTTNGVEMLMPCFHQLYEELDLKQTDIGFWCSGSSDYLAGRAFSFISAIDSIGAKRIVFDSIDVLLALLDAGLEDAQGPLLLLVTARPELTHDALTRRRRDRSAYRLPPG